MKLLKTFNEECVSDIEIKTYKHRKAVRSIVFDLNDNIALIHITKSGYYEIPGGGVEDGETFEIAIVRESKEETGCIVTIEKEIGSIIEIRKKYQMVNETFCYKVRVVGEKGQMELMPDEIESGHEVIWVSIPKAIELISSTVPENLYFKYIQQRALTFLEQFQIAF